MKYLLTFLITLFSINAYCAEHLRLNSFELVKKMDDKDYKSSTCTDLHNYSVCKLNKDNDDYELTIDKESHVIVAVTKTKKYEDNNSYFRCQAYHSKVSDVFKKQYNAEENRSSDRASTFNLKYLDYNYKIISRCLDSNSNLLSIYLKDFYSEMLKMKSEEYQKISEDVQKDVNNDLHL